MIAVSSYDHLQYAESNPDNNPHYESDEYNWQSIVYDLLSPMSFYSSIYQLISKLITQNISLSPNADHNIMNFEVYNKDYHHNHDSII